MITFASYLKDILNLNYLYFFKYKYLPSQDGFLWDYYVFVMNFILFLKGHRYLIRVVRSYFLDSYLTICILNHMHEISVQFSSITQLCPTLCDPMVCSTPGLSVHDQLPRYTQTHVRWVDDAIQPSHTLLSPSPPAFNLSQHQSLFQWVSSSHQVEKVLEFRLQC